MNYREQAWADLREWRRTVLRRRHVCTSLILCALMVGCSGVTIRRYVLSPAPNACQATEVRASAFSTVASVVCWDADGHVIGMASAGGQPTASIATAVIGAAGTVVGAAIIGQAMMEVGRSVQAARLVPDHVNVKVTAPQIKHAEQFVAP